MSYIVTVDQTIAASTDKVFGILTDFDHWRAWRSGLRSLKRLNNLAFGVGFAWEEGTSHFGRRRTQSFTVTRFEPDILVKANSRQGAQETIISYDFVPRGGLTYLSLQVEIMGLTRTAEVLTRVFGGAQKRRWASDVNGLRRMAERIPLPDHAPG